MSMLRARSVANSARRRSEGAGGGGGGTLLDEREGFALSRNVTGGEAFSDVVVTNRNDSGSGSLRAALSGGNRRVVFSPSVFPPGSVNRISLSSPITCTSSNVTVDGRGARVHIDGYGLHFEGNSSNIIVTNIVLDFGHRHVFVQGFEGIRVGWNGWCRDVWVHKVTYQGNNPFSAFDAEGLAVFADSRYVTLSYCYFFNWDHCVMVSSDETTGNNNQFVGDFVTIHHNRFNGCYQRHPVFVRHGWVHCYNNWVNNIRAQGASCAGGLTNSIPGTASSGELYWESNIIDNGNGRWGVRAYNGAAGGTYGLVNIVGTNIFQNCQSEERGPSFVDNPSTHYTNTATSIGNATLQQQLRDNLTANAGWQNVPAP